LNSTLFLTGKLIFYGRGSKSIACVAFVGKAADEVKVAILSKSFGAKKIQGLVKTSKN
jgi:hypothetical protein